MIDSQKTTWRLLNKEKLSANTKRYYNKLKDFSDDYSLETYCFKKYIQSASSKTKGKLTRNDIKLILQRQNFKCNITKLDFKSNPLFLPSIDRIDSEKFYSLDNCQIILTGLNLLKNKYDMKETLLFLKYIKNCF